MKREIGQLLLLTAALQGGLVFAADRGVAEAVAAITPAGRPAASSVPVMAPVPVPDSVPDPQPATRSAQLGQQPPAVTEGAIEGAIEPGAVNLAKEMRVISVADFGNILKRPLFEPSRRPPPPVVATATKPVSRRKTEALPDWSLLGVVTADGLKTAIVKTGSRGGSNLVAVGQALEGWQVTAISQTKVELTKAGETYSIELQRRGSAVTGRQGRAGRGMPPPGMEMP